MSIRTTNEIYIFNRLRIAAESLMNTAITPSRQRYMTLDTVKIEAIKDYFKTRPVLKAFLFGSFARGSADSASDIDILVDLDYNERIGLQFVQMKLDLEKLLAHKVDLVSTNGISKYIKPLVEKEKILIYAK